MTDSPARAPRSSVILYALVRADGRGDCECRVRNLSATGACIDNNGRLVVGQRITVDMGTLHDLPATVMWAERSRAGLHFDVTVDLAAARRPRGKAPATAAHAGWIDNMSNAYHHHS